MQHNYSPEWRTAYADVVWKVYTAQSEYVAACRDVEDAAALVAFRGDGATIRYDHKQIVWREGAETQNAAESYDHVASVAYERVHSAHATRSQRLRSAQDAFAADKRPTYQEHADSLDAAHAAMMREIRQ